MSDISICSKCEGKGCQCCDMKGFIDLNDYFKIPEDFAEITIGKVENPENVKKRMPWLK